MFQQYPHLNGVFLVVIASFFWGTTGTVASLVPDISSLAIGAGTMGLGGLLLVWNGRASLKQDRQKLRSLMPLIFVGGVAVSLYSLAFYTSMTFSGVAIGTLVSIASAPFFTVLMERLISKKRISARWLFSFVSGALGTLLLAQGKQPPLALVEHHNTMAMVGIGLGLVAGFCYAVYSWVARQMIEKGVCSKSAMASQFGLAALCLLPSLAFTGSNMLSDTKHVVAVLYIACIPMFLGYLCFGYALQKIEASKATLITLLEPAIATMFAIYVVGERFSYVGWYGIVLIVICFALQVFQPAPNSLPSKPNI